jgi:hypothetical protein
MTAVAVKECEHCASSEVGWLSEGKGFRDRKKGALKVKVLRCMTLHDTYCEFHHYNRAPTALFRAMTMSFDLA